MSWKNKHTGEVVSDDVMQWSRDVVTHQEYSFPTRVREAARFILNNVEEDWEVEVGQVFENSEPRRAEVVKVYKDEAWVWWAPKGVSSRPYSESFPMKQIKNWVDTDVWKQVDDLRDHPKS